MSVTPQQPLALLAIRKNGHVEKLGAPPTEATQLIAVAVKAYQATSYVPPWISYLAVAQEGVVGSCAFKGPPRHGMVEITLSTLPQHERKGFATAMARALLAIAAANGNPPRVGAQTPAIESAATSVLRRAGFVRSGMFHHPHAGRLWNWEATKTPSRKA